MESLQPSSKLFHIVFSIFDIFFLIIQSIHDCHLFIFKTEWESHPNLKKKKNSKCTYCSFHLPRYPTPNPTLNPGLISKNSLWKQSEGDYPFLHHICQRQPPPSTPSLPAQVWKCRNKPKGNTPCCRTSLFLPVLLAASL